MPNDEIWHSECKISLSMKITKVLLVVVMTVGLVQGAAAAEAGASCVEAYRQANQIYYQKLAQIDRSRRATYVVGGSTVVGWAACVWATTSVVGCTALSGAAVVAEVAYHHSQVKQAQQLTEDRAIYQVYANYKEGHIQDSPDVQDFLKQARVDVQREDQALSELARAMESGELCSKKGVPSTSYADVINRVEDVVR